MKYVPKIRHSDFFKLKLSPEFSYVVINSLYKTGEMAIAYYDKKRLYKHVKDIDIRVLPYRRGQAAQGEG